MSKLLDAQKQSEEPASIISPLMQLLREKEKRKEEKRKQMAEMHNYQMMQIPNRSESSKSKKRSTKEVSLFATAHKNAELDEERKYKTLQKGFFVKSR